jgi:basic membrane lipoprotein Med (substrate-binding protein (PBP1-ABC) superfamily)
VQDVILTSMLRRSNLAVFRLHLSFVEGDVKSGEVRYDLEQGGVELLDVRRPGRRTSPSRGARGLQGEDRSAGRSPSRRRMTSRRTTGPGETR